MTFTLAITLTGVDDAHDVDHALTAITTAAHSGDACGTGNLNTLHWTWAVVPDAVCIDCRERIVADPSPEGRCQSCHADNGPCSACVLGEHDGDENIPGHCDCCAAILAPAEKTDDIEVHDPQLEANSDPGGHVITDPDHYLGADLFSLDVLVQLLRANHNLPTAYVEQTGGGCAAVYAGETVRDGEGIDRWTCAAGPGSYGWGQRHSVATLVEFCVGPDSEDGTPGYTDANTAGCRTLRDVAALTAAQARTTWGELTDAPTLDALGLDSSLRSGLPEVLAHQARSRGYSEAANAALHAAYANGATPAEAGQASRAAGETYLAAHPEFTCQ